MQLLPLTAAPMPSDPVRAMEIEHQRLRRRILYSMHEADVNARMVAMIGGTRTSAWGPPDMTSNPAWYVTSQLAALYREVPEVAPPDGAEEVAAAIAEAGYWQLAQRVQRDAIGLNDVFVRVDLDKNTGEPGFRLVPPDLVEVTASPFAPSQPLAMREWIQDPGDSTKWIRLVVDPRTSLYQALTPDGADVSARVLGGDYSGERYPWVIAGKPVLPYVAYHAAESGYAMDPWTGREVFDGVLQLGVFYSFFGHIVRNAAHGQRWMMNVEVAGADLDDAGRRKEVVTDPATILNLVQSGDAAPGAQGQVGQFAPAIDPERILSAISRYEQRIVEMALSTVGVSRRESDVRSAMSLAVSREAQRDAQRAYEPVFRRSDLRLLRLVSGLMGAPMDGWRIRYKSVPRDPVELKAEMELLRAKLDAGLIDRVTAYRELHPGSNDTEAAAAITAIDAANKGLGPANDTPAAA